MLENKSAVVLLEDFAHKLPNLSILYKDIPVSKSVILISGYLVNNGSLDITKEMIEESLVCTIPFDCNWLEFKVTTSAPSLIVTSEIIDNHNVKLQFGLFRCAESFSFHALIQLSDNHANIKAKDFADKLRWRHRIASLSEVKTVQMPALPKRSKSFIYFNRFTFIAGFLLYFMLGLSQITSLGSSGKQPTLIFVEKSERKSIFYSISPLKNGMTEIKNLASGETKEINLETYTKIHQLAPRWVEIRKNNSSIINIIFGIFMIVGSFFILFFGFSTDYKRFQLKRLVSSSTFQINS